MKSREKGGVVDSRLNVYGVDGLKVAGESCVAVSSCCVTGSQRGGRVLDMSICPGNVAAVRA